jgi:enhancing lycopene biosynthesis protein 2
MKKRIGVVLSGCGVFDGSEIHEAVFTLLAIDRNGAEAVCMAPDMELDEVNHLADRRPAQCAGRVGPDRPGQDQEHQRRQGQ